MTQTKTNPIVRVLPSLTDLAFLMPIIFLFARLQGAKTMLGDGDTGWHIRIGEWMMAHGRVPDKDFFSFTKAGQPFYAWEWLWDLCFAWIYHHGGLATVVAASIVVLSVTFALLFRLVSRRCDNPFIAILATFLACAVSSLHWLARPHLFTLLFVVILLFILDRVEEGRPRWLLVLPPMTILWTNLHGGFLALFIVLAAYIAGEIAQALFTAEPEDRRRSLQRTKWYIATAFACAAATLVNPYTYHLHAHLIQYFSESFHMENILEFQSISFHNPAAVYLEIILLLAALGSIWLLGKHKQFVPAILVIGWAHLALLSARNIPLFGIVAAPIMAQALNEMLAALRQARIAPWLQKAAAAFRNTALEFGENDRLWRTHLISIAAALVLTLLLASPAATGKLKPEYDPQNYPSKALAVLRANPNSRIFTDDEWGDYLIFNLYPGHKVFVDGRSDFYGQDFEQKYLDLMEAKYDWEQYLNRYQVDTIVLSTKTALASVIKESRNWRLIYDDSIAIVFTAVRDRAP
ncbi:MAG TPA: hypothetical protein VKV15_27655, partial [Bryobacteraceae bacterium]|nr:hypothetical protein [Bryobacteraceae bacterium]